MPKRPKSGKLRIGTPTGIVLYRTPDAWQFSILDGGLTCGQLPMPVDTTPADAQTRVVSNLERAVGQSFIASWTPGDKPDSWTADLTPSPTS